MKKVIIVSKTHLDLGFTDFAKNIRNKYIDSFIPNAIAAAESVNKNDKRFVWTTGSWILKEALEHGSDSNRAALREALAKGNIAPHGMPFTTHTELLDEDTLEYGLSIVDSIDAITGRKTIACKMTDVPGHTAALVPALARHGMKLLHIGVNEASAMPDVPECFLWKHGSAEIVVIYSGGYGGEFKSKLIDEILYFDHTMDNHGSAGAAAVVSNYVRLLNKYKGYEVTAGRLDDYAEVLWEVRGKLPVVEKEIGDTWIHGSAADPYKSGAFRELVRLKNKWLAEGGLSRDSAEYKTLADNLLCVAEHTCGMDMKMYFADYENYLRKDFEAARKKDRVRLKHIWRDFPQNFLTASARFGGKYRPGSYQIIEKSWEEQRGYLDTAIAGLRPEYQEAARSALGTLKPRELLKVGGEELKTGAEYAFGGWKIAVNRFGGLQKLLYGENPLISENSRPALQYRSYGKADYDFWLRHYTRNLRKTARWAKGDFSRPLLSYADKGFRQGSFAYTIESGRVERGENRLCLGAVMKIDRYSHEKLGAAKTAQIVYTLEGEALKIEVLWLDKPANRLTESTVFRLYPALNKETLRYRKISSSIDPYAVVKNGGRNLSAVQSVCFDAGGEGWELLNLHSPLIGLGEGKILKFDNVFEDAEKDGLSFILHDNVWGTNFPLWYEDNAYFGFELKPVRDEQTDRIVPTEE